MGKRGPQPTPSEVLKQRGTFRADRAARNEAQPIGKPTCPAWLTDKDARKEFRRVAKLLAEMRLVGAADSNMLARYCTAWVRWRRVVQTLMSNPGAEFATYKDEQGKIKSIQVSALHSIARSLAEELSRYEGSCGMSPSARSRIEVQMPPAAEQQAKSRFFDRLGVN
jgi:P27 family predicted phage terminase small subunit